MSVRPGEQVHYVALLDEEGNTLVTVPLREPLECPRRAEDVWRLCSSRKGLASVGRRSQ
jgi:hypothetical protein